MGVGIVAFSGATETYSVDRMTFENNMAGIYDMMGIAPRITRNVFHVPDQGDLPRAPLGLLLNQSTAYVVEENQFIGNTGTSSVGIGFLGEQMANNQIYNNEFTHLTVGTMVAGRHKGNVPGHEYDGLQILCGDYLANTTDLGLWMFSYIRQDQGQVHTTNVTQSQLAGNRWLDPAIPNTSWDIAILVDPAQGSPENPPLPHINYFRHADEVCDPISPSDYYSDISVPEAGAFNKSTSCGMGDLQPPPGPPGEVRSTYLARAAQFESAAKQYRGTVNNGMKEEELIKAIGKNDPPYTSFALRDLILSASPVTDPVMTAMVQRPTGMDAWHMVQVLVANKPLSKAVKKAAELSERLSPYQLGLLEGSSPGGEVLELLKDELRSVGLEKARYQRHALHQLYTDSMETDRWSTFTNIIGQHPDLGDHYLLITGHILHGNDRVALDWLDSLEALGTKDTPGLDALLDVRTQLGAAWPYAGVAQDQVLKDNMEGTEAGAPLARALAIQAGLTKELPAIPLPDTNKARRVHRPRASEYAVMEQNGPRLFPDPCGDHTYLVFAEAQEYPISYRIVDAMGRVVKEATTTAGGQVFHMDLSGLASGAYLCEVQKAEGPEEVLQLVIQQR
jgi:hypothetical protein